MCRPSAESLNACSRAAQTPRRRTPVLVKRLPPSTSAVHAAPNFAIGRGAVGGAEPWGRGRRQVHPGVVRGARAAAGL